MLSRNKPGPILENGPQPIRFEWEAMHKTFNANKNRVAPINEFKKLQNRMKFIVSQTIWYGENAACAAGAAFANIFVIFIFLFSFWHEYIVYCIEYRV